MYLYPHSNDPGALGVMVAVIAPAVFLLGWLYNAWRLGKFKKNQKAPAGIARKQAWKRRTLLICCVVLCILAGLAIYFAG